MSEFAGNAGYQTRDMKPEVDTTTFGVTLVPLVTVPVTGHQQKKRKIKRRLTLFHLLDLFCVRKLRALHDSILGSRFHGFLSHFSLA